MGGISCFLLFRLNGIRYGKLLKYVCVLSGKRDTVETSMGAVMAFRMVQIRRTADRRKNN